MNSKYDYDSSYYAVKKDFFLELSKSEVIKLNICYKVRILFLIPERAIISTIHKQVSQNHPRNHNPN